MEDLNGNGQNGNGSGNAKGVKPPASMVKEFVAVLFRRRKLMRKVFLWSTLGALVAVLLFGILYESDMEILVRSDMVEPAVTPDANPRASSSSSDATLAINSEVELLMSNDVLTDVVKRCPMLVHGDGPLGRAVEKVTSVIPGYADSQFADAVKKLSSKLEITAVKDAYNIQVSYTANDPAKSGCVMANLANIYLAKHLAVNRPPKLYNFFAQQTEDYRKKLMKSEKDLLDFADKQDAVMAGTQAQIAVQQGSQFVASLRNTNAQIEQVREQINALESEKASVPHRIMTETKAADNINLLSNLKNTLNTLQNQRADYLFRYDENYRLVQDVDKQIAQTTSYLREQDKQPTSETTQDINPAYQWVDTQLTESKAQLPTLQAAAAAIAKNVNTYHREAADYNRKSTTQDDLQREVKAAETNYLLYLGKREQARIQDMMDSRRVLNVVLDESPTWPAIPTFSPLLLITLCFMLAGFLALGTALVADYLDPSFRTPDEVREFLDIPVFASIPENGHHVPVGTVTTTKNGY
jgi:uncharacterized protein involved in exopolysaccharide biosynthesis